MEIASDVCMIEGYLGKTFWIEPPSGNSFVLRDGDLVVMMDSDIIRVRGKDTLSSFASLRRRVLANSSSL